MVRMTSKLCTSVLSPLCVFFSVEGRITTAAVLQSQCPAASCYHLQMPDSIRPAQNKGQVNSLLQSLLLPSPPGWCRAKVTPPQACVGQNQRTYRNTWKEHKPTESLHNFWCPGIMARSFVRASYWMIFDLGWEKGSKWKKNQTKKVASTSLEKA